MGLNKKITYSVIFALIVFFASMFINIIPCQTAPDIPNPVYTWKMCTLNPDIQIKPGIKNLFLGFSESLTETYFIVLFIIFLFSMIILHFTSRKSGK